MAKPSTVFISYTLSTLCYNRHMKIADVGEFGLLARIIDTINKQSDKESPWLKRLTLGAGDDAAAWKASNIIQLATTDIMVEGIHFNLAYTGWYDLGWKAIAANISDIAAMGGIPMYALVSLAVPGNIETRKITDLYEGMITLSNKYHVIIVGGNISKADKVIINTTLIGKAMGHKLLSRSAAKPDDSIAVTGYPGLAATGYKALTGNLDIQGRLRKTLLNAHLRPVPRVNEAQVLLCEGIKTAIDISDGLIADLKHICEASGVSAAIYEPELPLHPALKKYLPQDYFNVILTGGEDYELIFTANRDKISYIQNKFTCPVTVIGKILPRKSEFVTIFNSHGKPVNIPNVGWDHYRTQSWI